MPAVKSLPAKRLGGLGVPSWLTDWLTGKDVREIQGPVYIPPRGKAGGYRKELAADIARKAKDPFTQRDIYSAVQAGADFIPLVGEDVGVREAAEDWAKGNYVMAGAGGLGTALGVVPVVGDVGGKLIKEGGKKLAKGLGGPSKELDEIIAAGEAAAAQPKGLGNKLTETGWTFKDVEHPHPLMEKGDWRTFNRAAETGAGVMDVELPIRSLYAAQKVVNPDFAKVPGMYGTGDPKAKPMVIKKGGKYFVTDGHHRLVAASEKGQQTANVRLLDLDRTTQTEFPLLDWEPPNVEVPVGSKVDVTDTAPDPGVKGSVRSKASNTEIPVSSKVDPVAPKGLGGPKIKAYHGSPHSFEEFDISKIGTGEGAQAYGHGLYFAENEGVAKSYRDTLASKQKWGELEKSVDELLPLMGADTPKLQGVMKPYVTQDLDRMLDALEEAGGGLDAAKAIVAEKKYEPQFQDAIAQKLTGIHAAKKGHMYEVDIAADPDAFLDWDKPLSEQSPAVQEIMKGQGYSSPVTELPPQYSTLGYTGARELRNPEEVARLKLAGIPGIKYFDAGSRAGGLGSRNYVVFDPKIVSIVKKYGIPAAIASGLISEEMGRRMQEQGDI